MSKNLKRIFALVLVLTLIMASFSMLTAQGYEAKVTGWPGTVNASYPWFANGVVTDEEKEATRTAMAEELVYQNDTLGFRMGTSDNGETSWAMSGWGNGMIVIEPDNHDASLTDNVGNPWGMEGRYWSAVIAPFPGMAFSVKGVLAANYDSNGGDPALSNEFYLGGPAATYQLYFNSYATKNSAGQVTSTKNFPGAKSSGGSDVTNNKFRYAVANYNQNNKLTQDDMGSYGNFSVGIPVSYTVATADNYITYQKFAGSSTTYSRTDKTFTDGFTYVAAKTADLEDGKLTGAYVIAGDLARTFEGLAATVDECFAITGAPVADAAGGKQLFENGVLSVSGFKTNNTKVASFSLSGEIRPAVVDNEASTITAFVSTGTSLSGLTDTVVLEDSGASYTLSSKDYSNAVTLKVTAASGDTASYTVTVLELDDSSILSFVIDGVSADIDYATKTITAVVGGDFDLKTAAPTVTTQGSSASVSPAGATDLSASWTSPVTYTVTAGSAKSEYKVQVRNKSKDTAVQAVVIPEGSLKYQVAGEDLAGTITGTTITFTYNYGNSATSLVPIAFTLPEYATVSPDPSIKRSQSNQTYTVTSENGETQNYTVKVSISTEKTFPAVDDLNMSFSDVMGGFGGTKVQALAKQAVLDEYNYQRTVLGFDPGSIPTDSDTAFSGWDGVLNRQFFDNGYGNTSSLWNHTAMICMDVPKGLAYTVKNEMLSRWQGGATDEDGNYTPYLFNKAGAPAMDEITMDGKTYQQFTKAYGNSSGMTMNGIGTFYTAAINALQGTIYYDNLNATLYTGVTTGMRYAYEYANQLGYNPGIALDGNLQSQYLGTYEDCYYSVTTADSKGNKITSYFTGAQPNYVLYQVFSGSGELRTTNRSSSDKTIIIKGANSMGVDQNSGLALFGITKTMYENLPKGTYQALNLSGFDVNYNTTYGTPTKYYIDENNDLIMEFLETTITSVVEYSDGSTAVVNGSVNAENPEIADFADVKNYVTQVSNKACYFAAPVADLEAGNTSTITYYPTSRYASDSTLDDVILDQAGGSAAPEVKVVYDDELYDPSLKEEYDATISDYNLQISLAQAGSEIEKQEELEIARDAYAASFNKFTSNAIYVNYPADAKVDITAIQFQDFLCTSEEAEITTPEKAEDGTYPVLDCALEEYGSGRVVVTAADGGTRAYTVYIFQEEEALFDNSTLNLEWGFWNVEPEPVFEPYYDDYNRLVVGEVDGVPVYDEDPNEQLYPGMTSANWPKYWGFYKDNIKSEENWVSIHVVDGVYDPVADWKNLYLENASKWLSADWTCE